MATDEEEKDFMGRVIPEIHELFDKEELFIIAGDKPNKDVLKIFLKANKLIDNRYYELRKSYSDDFYMDTSRIFYDAVYGYLADETEICHYSRGGWVLSCLAAFSIMCDLSSSLAMYLDDNEIPNIDPDNKYMKKLLPNKILKSKDEVSKIPGETLSGTK